MLEDGIRSLSDALQICMMAITNLAAEEVSEPSVSQDSTPDWVGALPILFEYLGCGE